MLSKLVSIIKDIFFPRFCVSCGQEGNWFCNSCFLINKNLFQKNSLTVQALDPACLDGITALFAYGENDISKLIKLLKYNFLLEITDVFTKIFNNIYLNNAWQDFVIIPVPLHLRRERERGFNQAEIIANLFAKKLGLNINKNLRRSIYTAQQARLTGQQRQVNLKGAFSWSSNIKNIPEKVLLVDDVFTTGATMQECAKVLKSNGAKIVWGLALARG
ncbi:MAG TPA: phosphoribosyltransferase family protein [Candidatus Udaeobacter sp.]|nr:phosphoribosyltransferase family protein [Candidatus Udaeobacter sp.]